MTFYRSIRSGKHWKYFYHSKRPPKLIKDGPPYAAPIHHIFRDCPSIYRRHLLRISLKFPQSVRVCKPCLTRYQSRPGHSLTPNLVAGL